MADLLLSCGVLLPAWIRSLVQRPYYNVVGKSDEDMCIEVILYSPVSFLFERLFARNFCLDFRSRNADNHLGPA